MRGPIRNKDGYHVVWDLRRERQRRIHTFSIVNGIYNRDHMPGDGA
jgi:hypothetical protein